MSSYPIADTAAAKALGAALREAGYSESAVHELLGEDAYSGDQGEAPVDERRLPETRLATVIRVFFLQRPVSTRDAVQVLGRRGVEALEATALAEVGDEIVPRVRILPIGKLLVAADGYSRDDDPPDYVAVYTPTSRPFDLITCNAPYVVSPERRWTYRDSGFRADEISERVVRDAAAHLAEGGFATLLVSWLAQDEDEPDERVLEWVEKTACDSWILPTWDSDPLGHASEWNSHLERDPEAFGRALDEWTEYFEELGVRWVSEDAVLLHRRPGNGQTTRLDSIDEDDVEDADDQIQRAFAARARLSELLSHDELLEARLSLEMAFWMEQELEPQDGGAAVVEARIQLSEGTNSAVDVEPRVLDVVASLDGRARLREVIRTVADRLRLSKSETSRLEREALRVTHELLELGALRLD